MRQAQSHNQQFAVDGASSSGCYNVGGQQLQQLRFDRQIQTSPSESPAVWPPPSVHGSPRHRRPFFEGVGGCECSTSATRTTRKQPGGADLYRWLSTSQPGARLHRAKYSYRPLRDSPNDNPETELSLSPGDYLLIFGDLDEDFYYRGELWTGERGLVPSNYVEPVSDVRDDAAATACESPLQLLLSQPQQQRSAPARHLLRAASERMPPTGFGASAFSSLRSTKSVDTGPYGIGVEHPRRQRFSTLPAPSPAPPTTMTATDDFLISNDAACPFPVVDVSNVSVQEIRPFDGARVPCPRDLLVERQLAKSVLISWSPPVNALCPVAQYHVCVDGEVRAVVPAGYKTKALIEDVDSRKVHRISVRAISDAGQSPDEACTVTLGRGSVVRPQDTKVTHVTPVSCEVSWYPSHSSCEHLVLLNGLKVGACPAGVYRVQLRGLIPSTLYRCAIRVKDPKAVLEEKPVESFVDFKTLPKIGLPDPPSDVHCEPGPQDGTLLVTWRPVSSQPKPPSRAAVAGYLVYADGRKVCEVDSPGGDHAVLRLQDYADDPPLFITVKTKTREGAVSSDSNVVRVPRSGANFVQSSTLTAADDLLMLNARTMSSQVAKNAYTQETFFAIPLAANAQPEATLQGTALRGALQQPIATATVSQTSTASPQFRTAAATASISKAPTADKALFSSNTPSYYVFHPRLATNVDSTAVGGGSAATDTLSAGQQEKPSLLEMETDYLSRHNQLQERVYHTAAPASSLSLPRPTAASRLQPTTSVIQEQQQTASAYRQAVFARRSYSLDEAPRSEYDPMAQMSSAQILQQPIQLQSNAPSAFHPTKHLRSAAMAVAAFNGPRQQPTVEESRWNDSSILRAAGAVRFDRTAPPGVDPLRAQSDRLLTYAGYEPTAGASATPLYANHTSGGRLKFINQQTLSSRHRRRLQDAAEARTLSEPDLLHYDGNNRYVLQQQQGHHHRRRRSKTPTRLVVALYDYSPRHMSPNPNGHLDELPFRKGQLIQVLGDKDADGFYRGELEGRIGLVPSNLVVEVEGGSRVLLNSPPETSMDYQQQQGNFYGAVRYREQPQVPPQDRYYSRGYGVDAGGVWNGGGSDPMLSRSHRHVREQPQIAAAPSDLGYDRYAENQQDRYATGSRTRRTRYKQKSHSLEYDLDRRDAYYEPSGLQDRGAYRPAPGQPIVGGEPLDYDSGGRLAARSLDRFHYQQQQQQPLGMVSPRSRENADNYGPRRQQPGRTTAGWPPSSYRGASGGYSDQDSDAELRFYQHQQPAQSQQRGAPPRRMSMYDQQQQQQQQPVEPDFYGQQQPGAWRGDEPSASYTTPRQRPQGVYERNGGQYDEPVRRGSRPYGIDDRLDASVIEMRKQQPPLPPISTEPFYDSSGETKDLAVQGRRGDSFRSGGRQYLEQTIRDAVMNGPVRRMFAKYDYDPKMVSPNPGAEHEELKFRAGDVITVYGDVDADRFYVGELNGRRALVPSNYLSSQPPQQQSGAMPAAFQEMQLANSQSMFPQMGGQQNVTFEQQQQQLQQTQPGRSKKDSVSFAATAAGDLGLGVSPSTSQQQPPPQPAAEKKPPSQTTKPPSGSAATAQKTTTAGGATAKRQPGQLKKADSTVGQKVPAKKSSTAGGSSAAGGGRKTSTAVSGGAKGAGGRTQEDGAIGKVWKKIVE